MHEATTVDRHGIVDDDPGLSRATQAYWDARARPCPTCGAGAGERCIGAFIPELRNMRPVHKARYGSDA